MTKNRPSLRALLYEFADETSAHGVGKIGKANSIFWRLFWVLVTLACMGMVIYQGILLLGTFLDKPTKSDIDVTYARVSYKYVCSYVFAWLLVLVVIEVIFFHESGKCSNCELSATSLCK